MTSVYTLANTTISAHAFNKDRSLIAICANSNDVEIRSLQDGEWITLYVLRGHDKLVTSIDWAPETNRIVTCSQDRNAYVWNFSSSSNTWEPTLVLLRLSRSATYVRWAPSEAKFAVASGANVISVCHYDAESNWWVAKHIKKSLSSTVLSLEWHPESVLLAAGSTDGRARVFSGYLKGVDTKPPQSVWGDRLPFGTVCADIASMYQGWIHDVAFSPSGNCLAFCAHDNTISFIYPAGPGSPEGNGVDIPLQEYYVVSHRSLPFVTLEFINENTLVAAGHDCEPILFELNSNGWVEKGSLDKPSSTGSKVGASGKAPPPKPPGSVGRLNNDAFNRFRQADSRGVDVLASSQPGASKTKETLHAGTITSLRPYAGTLGNYTELSTTGNDGRLVLWPLGITGGMSRLSV